MSWLALQELFVIEMKGYVILDGRRIDSHRSVNEEPLKA